MNKTELLMQISERAGLEIEDCRKVLDTFEEIVSAELGQSTTVSNAMDKVIGLLHFFKNNKG